MKVLAYIVGRLKEPSSYAGLAALLGLAGIHLAPDALQAIIGILVAVAGGAAIVIPDASK